MADAPNPSAALAALAPWMRLRRRDLAMLAALSLVVGASGALGASYVLGQGAPLFDGAATFAITVAGAALFAIAALLADAAFGRLCRPSARCECAPAGPGCATCDDEPGCDPALPSTADEPRLRGWPRAKRLMERLAPRWSLRPMALCCGLMALCWLPWLVANFPAGAYWDTYYQIWQTFPGSHPISIIPFGEHADLTRTDAYFCDHHPLLDTLIYGGFAQASQALTGTWQLGAFSLAVLQGGLAVLALTGACAWLRHAGAPWGFALAAYAFFCLAPFVSSWAFTLVKDSLFSLAYVPYFLMLGEAVLTRGEWLSRARRVALFAAVGVLLCLTKKTGAFVVVPTALIGALALRGCWRAMAAQALSCLLVMGAVLPLAVFPLMSVAPGGRQESLGPLLQQTAAYVARHSGDTTQAERDAIDAIVPYDLLAGLYEWDCHDAVKYSFRLDATSDDVISYIYVWAAQGLRHPDAYLGALMGVAGSYLAPCQPLNVRTTTCDTYIDDVHVLYNPPELDGLRLGLAGAYDAWAATPVLSLPLQACLYSWWLPMLLAYVAWRRRAGLGLLFVPGAIVLGFCLIGPIFDARYCLPLLYTVPLLAGTLGARVRQQGIMGPRDVPTT